MVRSAKDAARPPIEGPTACQQGAGIDRQAAVEALVARLDPRIGEIADRVVAQQSREIPSYDGLAPATRSDIRTMAVRLLEWVLDALGRGTELRPEQAELLRVSAERRVRQRVPMDALLHAYRTWQQVFWHEIQASITTPGEREAALWIAERLMMHVNAASTVVAQAYLDAQAGVSAERDLVRRDLLEALISGRTAAEYIRAQVDVLIAPDEHHVVVIARHRAPLAATHDAMRAASEVLKRQLGGGHFGLKVGLRDDEAIVITRNVSAADAHEVARLASVAAQELGDFVIGIGRRHAGESAIAESYAEACQAVEIAMIAGGPPRAIAFVDVLLDHILRSSPEASTLLDETIAPLIRYDELRHASLLSTLRTYFESTFNLTRSAALLHVDPNTVRYRLQRIAELTGQDPAKPKDLLLLLMGLQLHDLGASAGSQP